MLNIKYGPWQGASSYGVASSLVPTTSDESTKLAAMRFQDPYGVETELPAGLIGRVSVEGGETVVDLASSTVANVIIASSYSDSSQSGKIDFYYLIDGVVAECYGNYDTAQTYTVGSYLTYIPSGTNQGKLTPVSNYSSQPIVAMVVEAPENAANDDVMTIKTLFQAEGA